MNLQETIKLLIKEQGKEALLCPGFLGMLEDYGAFKEEQPSVKVILRELVRTGQLRRIIESPKKGKELHFEIKFAIAETADTCGFKNEIVSETIAKVAIAIGKIQKPEDLPVCTAQSLPERTLPLQPSKIDKIDHCEMGMEHFQKGDYASALESFKAGAEQKNRECLYMLGKMYYEAYGVPRRCRKGLRYYEKSAELGHVEAMYKLGMICVADTNAFSVFQRKRRKGIKWLTRASQKGNRFAYKWLCDHTVKGELIYGKP